jgi:transposase
MTSVEREYVRAKAKATASLVVAFREANQPLPPVDVLADQYEAAMREQIRAQLSPEEFAEVWGEEPSL